MEQAIEAADKLYNQKLTLVLNFFASKLQQYYSSSRLTLLLTCLSTNSREPNFLRTCTIPLPSRLKVADENALDLHCAGGLYTEDYWRIFQDFLDSSDAPLAFDRQKYTIAALACLKILFGHYQTPISHFAWFSHHCRALRIGIAHRSKCYHAHLPVGRSSLYWHLKTRLPYRKPHEMHLLEMGMHLILESMRYTESRSDDLQFLLEKSACSDNILDFARYRVFRFAYLHRKHPVYMKKAIFSLAKYIQRVTGETAEVRTCESIWGRDRWFTAQ